MPASIFQGNFVKNLKANLKFGNDRRFLHGTDDPNVTAQDAEIGSLYFRDNGQIYRKLDTS